MDNREYLPATILYVDDEEMARKYFVRTFGKEHEVLAVPSADAAIDILKSEHHRIGVLITDYRMPGKNGIDLLRQVTQEYPHVVRILMTAYADKDVLLESVNSGEVFRILEKPLDLLEVRKALRVATELSRTRSATQQRLMAIEETLAFLAHELNTPLATVLNFARGIERRVGNSDSSLPQRTEIGNAATAIGDNARYCLTVLSSFVDSLRNAGMAFTNNDGTMASQLVLALLDTYPLAHDQRTLINLDVKADFRITALPNCVALVLSSVLNNALRALEGQPAPTVSITVLAEDVPQIRISDNGPGIPPEVREHLLVDPITTHADSGGSGRGMIFCNRIMQAIGGSLLIQSEPAKYTTITLNFPPNKEQLNKSDR